MVTPLCGAVLSVYEDIAYGLKARKVPGKDIADKIGRIIQSVHLEGLSSVRPAS